MFIRQLEIPGIGGFLWFCAVPALGHAILLSATPEAGQSVRGPDVPLSLRFNTRIHPKRSKMTLIERNGARPELVVVEQSSPDTLSMLAKGLAPGSYTLRWWVSADDGHITRGELGFLVN